MFSMVRSAAVTRSSEIAGYLVAPSRFWPRSKRPVVQFVNRRRRSILVPDDFSATSLARICAVVGAFTPENLFDVSLVSATWAERGVPVILGFVRPPIHNYRLDANRGPCPEICREMIDQIHIEHPDNADNPGLYRFVNVVMRHFSSSQEMIEDRLVEKLMASFAMGHQRSRAYPVGPDPN